VQITTLIDFPSPKLALEFIKGLDKDTDAMAVDPPSGTEAIPAEDAPAEAAPAETEET
jgi:hypothetical protein